MEDTNIRNLITDTEALLGEYDKLKEIAVKLHQENKQLRLQNHEIIEKNHHAQTTIQRIVERLKEVQA